MAGDDWLARDKAEHLIACMAVAIAVGGALGFSSRLRRWRIQIGCVAALAAGAAKEAMDELHLWNSSGASGKDAVADILGAVVGAAVLWSWPKIIGSAAVTKEASSGDHAV